MLRSSPLNQSTLARRLRLSRTTVSRSLSGHPAIAAATRDRVRALADELGYSPGPTQSVARTRQARSLAFGVLTGRPLVPEDGLSLPRLLDGIRRRAGVESARVDVVSLADTELTPEACRRAVFGPLRTGGWRGALLLYPFPQDTVTVLAAKLPLVALLTEAPGAALDLIDTDHGAITAHVAALVARGHERIGFVHWAYAVGGHWGPRRFAAYAAALAAHGLPFDPTWTCNVHTAQPRLASPAAIAAHVTQLARPAAGSPPVTAWVCAADHQAYRLIADLQSAGLRVPRDVAVTGFDGQPVPPGLPAAATAHVPYEDIGASAVARLISRLLEPTSPRRTTLVEPRWDAGETLGPKRTSSLSR